MYRTVPGLKRDPIRRWNLPDRVFFACGACHILTYAFLQKYPGLGFGALWIKPNAGFTGNHIVAVHGDIVFDYHGYSSWSRLQQHMWAKANRWWLGWSADVVPLPADVLISGEKSKSYDGLWLREPEQFLHDALPRANEFLGRFPDPRLQVPARW